MNISGIACIYPAICRYLLSFCQDFVDEKAKNKERNAYMESMGYNNNAFHI
jgi:hypothetical protein